MEVKIEISKEQLLTLIAQRKFERDLNKTYHSFGGQGEVTISDATRLLHSNPELLKMVDEIIDKYLDKKDDKQTNPSNASNQQGTEHPE